MKHFLPRRAILVACAVLSTALMPATVLTPPVQAKASATTYSGRATVVNATVLGLPAVVLSDTGPLPSSGGALETSLLTASVPGLLSVDVLHATTVGQNGTARAEASVADVQLTVGGNSIGAGFLMSRAAATCTTNGCTESGSSDVANLSVNGGTIAVTGQPNQTVDLLVGKIVINEQTVSEVGGTCSITVNALHVEIPGIADVIVSSAHADIHCGTTTKSANDFITGGGWITGTPSGAKGNFGVAGGLKQGRLWGHLTYIDHGSGMKVRGTGVTGYVALDDVTRRITGDCEIDGAGGFTYQVDVADRGEPGTNDSFSISLSSGYSASGYLDGGNIQLHRAAR